MTTLTQTSNITRSVVTAALVLGATIVSTSQAGAVSLAVKLACASDYYAHCSAHPVGSPGVRQCMRAVGPNLSMGCISALIKAGEVSKAEIARHKAAMR
jgi:hypothetical protein